MGVNYPSSDDGRRVLLEKIGLMGRPESGRPLVQIEDKVLELAGDAHRDLMEVMSRHASEMRKVVEVEGRVAERMPDVRGILSSYWAIFRQYQLKGERYAEVLDFYGYRAVAVSRMRDIDAVRALKAIIRAVDVLGSDKGAPASDSDGAQASARLANIPVIQAFSREDLIQAVAGLEEDLVFVLEVRGNRKRRASEMAVVRKQAIYAARRVLASIRYACIDDPLIDVREKLRAFGFEFNVSSAEAEAASPAEGAGDGAEVDAGEAAAADAAAADAAAADAAAADAASEASSEVAGVMEVMPEALASQG